MSVVLPVRNGLPLLRECLRRVVSQKTPWPFEVIAIDSGSTDGSWEELRAFPVRAERIRAEQFNHGGTRNLAADMAAGDFIVFLVQDAVAANEDWLRNLIDAAETPGAAASYSRQTTWPHDSALVSVPARRALPGTSAPRRQALDGRRWEALAPSEKFALSTFHNNSSCVRREVLARYPFAELPYGEDLEWAQRVIRAGYALVFEPASVVYHSHDRSWWYELKRAYADHELVVRLFGHRVYRTPRSAAASWLRSTLETTSGVWAEPRPFLSRVGLAARAPLLSAARIAGSCLGAARAGGAPRSVFWRRLDLVLRRGV